MKKNNFAGKMKKTATILLLFIYALASFGIGIKQFYCCGKLKSTTIAIVKGDKEKCGMGYGKSGCCKAKFKSFKVKDSHVLANPSIPSEKLFSEISIPKNDLEFLSYTQQFVLVNNPAHAPPQYSGVPLHIRNCVFRI